MLPVSRHKIWRAHSVREAAADNHPREPNCTQHGKGRLCEMVVPDPTLMGHAPREGKIIIRAKDTPFSKTAPKPVARQRHGLTLQLYDSNLCNLRILKASVMDLHAQLHEAQIRATLPQASANFSAHTGECRAR